MHCEPPLVMNVSLWKSWQRPLRSHVVAVVFLLPFLLFLAIHRYLGLSDAMMVAPTPSQPHSMIYNFVMIGAFWFGVSGYLMHVLFIADRSTAWIVVKLAVLWGLLILAMP